MFLNLDKIDKNRIALVDDTGVEISYNKLIQESEKFAESFKKGDFVFHLVDNSNYSFIDYYGFINRGVISLILSSKIDSSLLQNLISIYKPNYIVVEGNNQFDKINEVLPNIKDGRCIYSLNDIHHDINEKVEFLMSTSGSTGSPKLVKYKKGNLDANALNVAETFGWNEDEVSLCSLPMNYTMGLNVINSQLVKGAKAVLTNYNVATLEHWKLVDKYKVTNFTGVPFTFEIMKRFRLLNKDMPSLKTICQGGGKLTRDLFESLVAYADKYDKRFIASFGTTETSARMMMLDPSMASMKTQSIGKAIKNGKAYLVDENGEKIEKSGINGELVYEGPNVTMGYATNLEELALGDAFKGTYHTGDLAYFDEDGFFYISGRLKRFIKINGNRIGLDDVENRLKEDFAFDLAASGEDDNLKIFVTDNSAEEEIKDKISALFNINKLEINIFYIEKIPRNDTGKVLYKNLK